MINAILDLLPTQRSALTRVTDRISDLGGPTIDASALDQLLARAKRRGRGAALRTQAYVIENPRKTGLGVGAAVGVAVGLVALTKMYETRRARIAEMADDAASTAEELADELKAKAEDAADDIQDDIADTDTLPA